MGLKYPSLVGILDKTKKCHFPLLSVIFNKVICFFAVRLCGDIYSPHTVFRSYGTYNTLSAISSFNFSNMI